MEVHIMGNEKVVRHTLNVSGGSLPDGFNARLNVEIDYSNVDHDTLVSWATSNRVIALQRVLRTLPTKTLNDMAEPKNGPYKVHARDCGKKIVSREQRIEDIANTFGVSTDVATIMVDNPSKLSELLAKK
jgi:hypothetical protein